MKLHAGLAAGLFGFLLLGCQVTGADAQMRAVTGELVYHERKPLPDRADAVAEFHRPDGTRVLRVWNRTQGRQVPLPFMVEVPANQSGTLTGSIVIDGQTRWRSEPLPVPAGSAPIALGPIPMQQVAAGPAEAASSASPPSAPAPEGDADAGEMEPETAAPTGSAADGRFRCGEEELTITADSTGAVVTAGSVDVEMDRRSDGTYWVSGDSGSTLALDDNSASVTLAGVSLPECTALD